MKYSLFYYNRMHGRWMMVHPPVPSPPMSWPALLTLVKWWRYTFPSIKLQVREVE